MGGGKPDTGDLAEAVAFFCSALLFLWFLARPLPWTGILLPAAVVFSWRRRSLTVASLGLGWKELCRSVRSWSVLWVLSMVLFVALGHRVLFRLAALEQGCVYFAWAAVQLVVYQSMMYMPLRNNLRSPGLAAGLSGLAFALMHVPNPVLVAGTFVWGVVACLLFERCRSVWGLALMQVMLSSMLFWVTPAELNRNFRIGPYYYEIHSQTLAPPLAASPAQNPAAEPASNSSPASGLRQGECQLFLVAQAIVFCRLRRLGRTVRGAWQTTDCDGLPHPVPEYSRHFGRAEG